MLPTTQKGNQETPLIKIGNFAPKYKGISDTHKVPSW